ncbi:MAG: mechanosensitive ion channel family protein [Ilumatobacter sp.]|uniref:mechanosensitive ion channel family protein n=1 Tax=Ilumatobacter sp. TaxID=1967498 RepID=UPI003C793072
MIILRLPTDDESTDSATEQIASAVSDAELGPWDFAIAAGIFIGGIVLAYVIKTLVARSLQRRNRMDPALAALIARLVSYVVMIVGFIYALQRLGIPIGLAVGGLGIAGIALAFALQDILENFIAGVLLQIQRPFTYGDQILVNDHEGTVQMIDTRMTTILTPAGELVKIPSATVIKSDITNYTQRGSRRTTLPVGVAYGTDLKKAQRILLEATARATGVLTSPAPEAYLEAFGDSSIDFAVRFWHKPSIADFWAARSEVAFEVEAALAEAGITIPFPQRTMWWAGDTDA